MMGILSLSFPTSTAWALNIPPETLQGTLLLPTTLEPRAASGSPSSPSGACRKPGEPFLVLQRSFLSQNSPFPLGLPGQADTALPSPSPLISPAPAPPPEPLLLDRLGHFGEG